MADAAAGLDPKQLQSSTAVGVQQALSAARARVELMARLFGADFMAPMFGLINRLTIKHNAVEQEIRKDDQFIQIDPRAWNADAHVDVKVGTGRGTNDEKLAALGQTLQVQIQALTTMGPDNPLLDLTHLRNTLDDMLKLGGIQATDRHFNEVAKIEAMTAQAKQAKQGQPSPEQQKAMADAKIAGEKAQAEIQLNQQKAAAKTQQDQATAAHQQQMDQFELQHKRKLAEQELVLKRDEAAAKIQIDRDEMVARMELKAEELRLEAELEPLRIAAKTQAGNGELRSPIP
jgi:hypothetical protein